MPDGLASRLPDLNGFRQSGQGLQSGIGGVIEQIVALAEHRPDSAIGVVTNLVGTLNDKVQVDTSALSSQFPDALGVMASAVPDGAVDFVRSIESAYGTARSALSDSHLVRAIGEGDSVETVALAAVQDALAAFDTHRAQLLAHLVDSDTLSTITGVFGTLEGFETDFATHRADFLPFLSRNLFGVAPDLLDAPRARVDAFAAELAPLTRDGLNAAIAAARDVGKNAFVALNEAIDRLDPTNAAGYAAVQTALDTLNAAVGGLLTAIRGLYATAGEAVRALPLDELFHTLARLLEAITVPSGVSLDDVVRGITDVLDGILARLQSLFGPDDIAARIRSLSTAISDLFAASPLGQVQKALNDFLDSIRQAIESVPTDEVKSAVEGMLARVREEIDKLGLDRVGETIDQAFQAIDDFVQQQLDSGIAHQVRTAIQSLLDNLNALPIRAVTDQLIQVLAQIQSAIAGLKSALESGIEEVRGVLEQLDGLSFKPISDPVIAEIDAIKAKLAQINPDALSGAEKLALKGALVVISSINLEDFIKTGVKSGFTSAKDSLLSLVDQLVAALQSIRERFDQYGPDRLMSVVTDAIGKAEKAVEGLDARLLLRPLQAGVDELGKQLSAHSPAQLLTPIEAPFEQVVQVVRKLDPAQIVAPLNAIYDEVDRLIGKIDITPLLDQLDQRQKQILAEIRTAVVNAVDGVHLPEPLAGFFDQIKPLITALSDALFQSPDTELQKISLDLRGKFRPSDLFGPLDAAFDRLVGTLDKVPQAELVSALNTLRSVFGEGMALLDPAWLRELLGESRAAVAELAPPNLLSLPLNLPSLRASFSLMVDGAPAAMRPRVEATLARFDAVNALLAPGLADGAFAQLRLAHAGLLAAIDQKLAGTDSDAAEVAYGRFRAQLTGIVPAFLRQTTPLTYPEIIAGLQTLRPSQQVAVIDRTFDRFLAALTPIEAALEPAINYFFAGLRDMLRLVSPPIVKDGVASVYAAVRAKVRVLDPAELAAGLSDAAFKPAMDALNAIDPAALNTKLQAAFDKAVHAVTDTLHGILTDVGTALDEQLAALKEAVKEIAGRIRTVIDEAMKAFEDLAKDLENLVFVDVFDRLKRVIESLALSFDRELDRVVSAFDAMLRAIPLDNGAAASVSVA